MTTPLLAGAGFGLYFILIDQVSESAVFWLLVVACPSSMAFLSLVLLRRRGKIRQPLKLPLLA